jgi:hypothetical protein
MTGEPMEKVEQAMDQARALLTEAEASDGRGGLPGPYFTADTLLARQATCYTEAGKPAKAAALFADVIAALSRRDAGFFSARRAAALALCGEPDEAASVGIHAIHMATETNSGRTLSVLADVAATLSPWRGRPGPRALAQALATGGRLASQLRRG